VNAKLIVNSISLNGKKAILNFSNDANGIMFKMQIYALCQFFGKLSFVCQKLLILGFYQTSSSSNSFVKNSTFKFACSCFEPEIENYSQSKLWSLLHPDAAAAGLFLVKHEEAGMMKEGELLNSLM